MKKRWVVGASGIAGIGACLAIVAACAVGGGSDMDVGGESTAAAPSTMPRATADTRFYKSAVPQASSAYGTTRILPPTPHLGSRENYQDIESNGVTSVSEKPVSTFSVDVDTASYANVRRFLRADTMPPPEAVRIEELVNYFPYDYPKPATDQHPFRTTTTILPAPWAKGRQLLHIAIQGKGIDVAQRPPANLTFLIDVSGSMQAPDKLPLVQKAFNVLLPNLTARDKVAIVTYAGSVARVLDPTPGDQTDKIAAAVAGLGAGGGTSGQAGLTLAYDTAQSFFDADAVNRVILATDGDFNVGLSSPDAMGDFIAERRESGIYLSVLGFGTGNLNDYLMQQLAQRGNGNAAYIDSILEARKVMADELTANIFPIANDVKIQVEFNPKRVAEYRLIGFETRALKREDFSNDKIDAGDIGSGHRVTALYEIVTPDSPARRLEPLRYAAGKTPEAINHGDEFAFLRLRYKRPGADQSELIERPITDSDVATALAATGPETRFALAVAGFGQILRGDDAIGDGFGYQNVTQLASNATGDDPFGYRSEFLQLVAIAKTLSCDGARLAGGTPSGRGC